MRLDVVIALLDEKDLIGPLLQRLTAVADQRSEWDWRIVLVIEGTDGTRDIAQAWTLEDRRVHVISREEPRGLANAFRTGFEEVRRNADSS